MAKKKKKKSSKKKKKKNSISKTNQKLLAKAEALKKITEHNRDYLSLNLTIPLGSSALKNVHTNQWLFTNLPKEFDLANWTIIANALNSSTNRYSGYMYRRDRFHQPQLRRRGQGRIWYKRYEPRPW